MNANGNRKVTWVVVADAARARFFSLSARRGHAESEGEFEQAGVLNHPDSRAHVADLVSDQSGRSFGSTGHGNRSAMGQQTDPKETEAEVFAREIVRTLSHDRTRFEALALVAPPHFLGLLRNELTPELTRQVVATLDKDLLRLDHAQMRERLTQLIDAAVPVTAK